MKIVNRSLVAVLLAALLGYLAVAASSSPMINGEGFPTCCLGDPSPSPSPTPAPTKRSQ